MRTHIRTAKIPPYSPRSLRNPHHPPRISAPSSSSGFDSILLSFFSAFFLRVSATARKNRLVTFQKSSSSNAPTTLASSTSSAPHRWPKPSSSKRASPSSGSSKIAKPSSSSAPPRSRLRSGGRSEDR